MRHALAGPGLARRPLISNARSPERPSATAPITRICTWFGRPATLPAYEQNGG